MMEEPVNDPDTKWVLCNNISNSHGALQRVMNVTKTCLVLPEVLRTVVHQNQAP
jgi:hypothetical protein